MAPHKYGSNVPFARGEFEKIARSLRAKGDSFHADWVESLLHHLHRKDPVRRTPARHPAPTKAQKARIRRLARDTDLSQQAIAEAVGVNAGRVSETLNGN